MPPVSAFRITRRNLPHWQQPGSTYFLTWCSPLVELEPDDRTLALNAILFWDARRWDVYSAVVMADHVHLLARPRPLNEVEDKYHDLSVVLHSVKSYASHQINSRRGRRGTVWQDETYDRIVRNQEEFEEKWQYIRMNPVKTCLAATPEEYPWLYEAVFPQ